MTKVGDTKYYCCASDIQYKARMGKEIQEMVSSQMTFVKRRSDATRWEMLISMIGLLFLKCAYIKQTTVIQIKNFIWLPTLSLTFATLHVTCLIFLSSVWRNEGWIRLLHITVEVTPNVKQSSSFSTAAIVDIFHNVMMLIAYKWNQEKLIKIIIIIIIRLCVNSLQ